MYKKLLTGSLLLSLIIFVSSCSRNAGESKSSRSVNESVLDRIMKRRVIKVGMSTFLPWAMKSKSGKLIGFEIDIARRLADDLGVKVQFIPTKWSGIIPALLTKKFDIIIGGMGIRPQRNLKVNFSIPYDYTGMSIVANKSNSSKLKSLEDYNSEKVKIAVRIGTTAAAAVKKIMPKANVILFDDEAQGLQELLLGRVNALVASDPLPAFQSIKYSEKLFLPLPSSFTKEPIGFAIRKNDYNFQNLLDNWIRTVKSEGWFSERKNYWFRTRKWNNLIQ